jgi:8-oxo-dGTP pyrophosphatase MutT (NUDIX family)
MELEIKRILSKRKKIQIVDEHRRASAVLIPIYRKDADYYIVLIRRTKTVKTHKGQISFPGGARDSTDGTLLYTALRESLEEIGLHTEDITVLGELDDEITTTSDFIVTPFAAMIPWPYRFIKNEAEVAEIISIPISALQDKACLKMDIETTDGGIVLDSYNFFYGGNVIWGATARILKKFLDIINEVIKPRPECSS